MDAARSVAEAADPMEKIDYGPWLGADLALPDDLVSREFIADGQNYHYVPAFGYWKRRGGQSQKFDTFGAAVGMLPAKWGAKARWMEEFVSETMTDGVPTIATLLTKETVAAGLDDGRYGTLWLRDQVNSLNYTLGSEFSATTYNPPGSTQWLKIVPLWYESGDGGITRGQSELTRRFFLNGSRRFLKVGQCWYFPSRLGTPSRWRGNFGPSVGSILSYNINRLLPSGPISPTHSGTVAAGTPSKDGPWKGSDRFAYSVAYRFEDGSIWAPCPVRLPNDTLPNGFGIATVDITNPGERFRSVTFSSLPIGPHGVIERIICRGPKVDATGANPLNISPYDLRPIGVIRDNVSTSWECSDGDDATLPAREVAEMFIRHDYMMPPRARYIFGGDMRVCHAYGGDNPCAIQIVPIARSSISPLNAPDTGALFSLGSYMRIDADDAAGTSTNINLTLIQTDAVPAVAQTITIDFVTYNTLQKLVDKINSSSTAVDIQAWRAQLCPGVNPEANPADVLVPHNRNVSTCQLTNGSANLDRASGGLSRIAVGARIRVTGTPAMDGFVVTAIVSDTRLTMSANSTVTNAAATIAFYFELGDDPTAATTGFGYQRVIANSLPGFLYFTKTELDKGTFDKSAVWMTTASPGQAKSAPNCFSRKIANRHTPPVNAGICLGGGAVDNGFVVVWNNKRGAIRNTRDSGTGVDEDYRVFITNESSGGISWNTIVPGNRFVTCLAPEGIVCADLFDERLVSEGIWIRSVNGADTASELKAQMDNDAAATAADADTARSHLRIMRNILWFGYHPTTGTSHPSRLLPYDFSGGMDSNGLASLMRAPGVPWGWGVKQVQSFSALAEARRADGPHLYGWDENNAGSTGDGRIDEFETGDTDNRTAISAILVTPWERAKDTEYVSAQEVRCEHSTPAASTVKLDLYRSFVGQTQYEMTPTGEDSVSVTDQIKKLPQAARVVTDAVYLRWRQSAGVGGQLRRLQLRLKRRRRYK
jgi:hypothetical protein